MTVAGVGLAGLSFPFLRSDNPLSMAVDGVSGPIAAARFLSDVAALAERLPDGQHVVNLCADRYRFAVAFAAALTRRQVTLLPSSTAEAPLMKLSLDYRKLYFIHDDAPAPTARSWFQYPQDLDGPCSDIPEFPADQQAVILFTSGSTGAPAAHPRSWGAMVNSTRAAAQQMGVSDLGGAEILGTVPHQHSYGLESIMMLALQQGMAFHCARPLLPADIVDRLERMQGPRILVTTPVHLRSLVTLRAAMPPVDRIICATAPLSPDLAQEAEELFAARLYEIYGCSEVGQIAVRRTTETLEWTTIDGIDLHESKGEIRASGPAAAAETPLNDVIELRGPRHFLLHGRKSDMINIAGKRSSLSFLNHILNEIEGVQDGVFVMPEDSEAVTRLSAYVVAPGLTPHDILAALRRQIDPAFLPRPLHFVESLPRNTLGKLTREAMETLPLAPVTAEWRSSDHSFAPDHPTAQGHFPGNPLIPGALLLDHVLRAIAAAAPREIRFVKFLHPVRPGDRVTIRWRGLGNGDIEFECRQDGLEGPVLLGALKRSAP